MSFLIGLILTMMAFAFVAVILTAWLAGMTGPAVFLTLIWTCAAVFVAYWLGVVPAGRELGVWLGYGIVALVSLIVIWAPSALQERPASYRP